MGEIAEMILGGGLCEGCGEYMEGGSGFPRYCSRQCAMNRGAARPVPAKADMRGAPLRGDWLILGRFIGDREVHKHDAARACGWSSNKLMGVLNGMISAAMARHSKGGILTMTQKGLARLPQENER